MVDSVFRYFGVPLYAASSASPTELRELEAVLVKEAKLDGFATRVAFCLKELGYHHKTLTDHVIHLATKGVGRPVFKSNDVRYTYATRWKPTALSQMRLKDVSTVNELINAITSSAKDFAGCLA